MSAAVRVSGLSGGYAPGTDALRDVEFAAGPGQIVGVLGPNGGGKTTLFRALLGELPVRRGDVALPGRPASAQVVCMSTDAAPPTPTEP